MPNPTAHADDMKSLAVIEPNNTPAFWWVNPWGYALGMKRALDAVHLLSETTEDAYQAAKHVIKQKEELADYHRNKLNTFQRKVELALKPACPHLYEDTIGYVHWAADEIKALKASLSVMTEDRDAYIEKYQKAVIDHNAHNIASGKRTIEMLKERDDDIDELQAALDGVTKHRNQALKNLVACQTHIEKLEGKRKTAKKKAKAAPLVDIKTSADSFTYGNHEDRHSPAREAYSAIGRRFLKHLALRQAHAKAIAKAKKKGGRK